MNSLPIYNEMNDMSNFYDCKVIDQVVKYLIIMSFLGDSNTAMCKKDFTEDLRLLL